jgi:predicted TIM-barrel enzyme
MFPGIDLETHATWTDFYLADVVIITGEMTGIPPKLEEVKRVKELVKCPVLVGSGMRKDNIAEFLKYADGAIVGTSLKVGGDTKNPVDVARVKALIEEAKKLR